MIGIYKITNPKGKVYVGQSVDIPRRWKKYNSLNCSNQTKLINSFNKYGIVSHTFEILEICNESDLNRLERYWQDYYNVLCDGLNCKLTEDTDKTGILSNQTKLKIGDANRGKIHSEISKYNMSKPKSDSSKMGKYDKSGKNNPFYGKSHSDETKKIIKEKRKQQVFSDETKYKISNRLKKTILQFTINGEFVAEYKSRNDAANSLNISPTMISNNISGRKKTAGGYVWKYK